MKPIDHYQAIMQDEGYGHHTLRMRHEAGAIWVGLQKSDGGWLERAIPKLDFNDSKFVESLEMIDKKLEEKKK